MSLCRNLLVTVAAFLANADTFAAANNVRYTNVGLPESPLAARPLVARSVRVDKTVHADEDGDNISDFEERAGGLSSKVSNIFSKFTSKESQVARWAEVQKSDDFVKEKLKLKGLSGDALKLHKNYEYFDQFKRITEMDRLNGWLKKEVPTYGVWVELRLGNVHTMEQIAKAMHSDAFRIYTRYVEMFDNRVTWNAFIDKKPVPVVSSDATSAEKTSRTVNWVATNRPEAYVKMALGLDKLPPTALAKSENYQFYQLFLQASQNEIKAGAQVRFFFAICEKSCWY